MIESKKLKDLLVRLCSIKENGTLDGEEADRSENLHRLFMYPAMMVPATQSAIVEIIASELGKDLVNSVYATWGTDKSSSPVSKTVTLA